jgi:hypothetical protein
MFQRSHQSCSGAVRQMGPAELLLEATFTDMRNGGDGDLSQAYKFAKKVRYPSYEQIAGDVLCFLPIVSFC